MSSRQSGPQEVNKRSARVSRRTQQARPSPPRRSTTRRWHEFAHPDADIGRGVVVPARRASGCIPDPAAEARGGRAEQRSGANRSVTRPIPLVA